MSKSVQRIIMLLLLGVGLGGFGIYQIAGGPDSDHIALGIVYLAAGLVAFGAVLRLPTKPVE
jgi:hypothetical protein